MLGVVEVLLIEFELGVVGVGLLVGGFLLGMVVVVGVIVIVKFVFYWLLGLSVVVIGSSLVGGRFSKWISVFRVVNVFKVGVKNGSRSRLYEV